MYSLQCSQLYSVYDDLFDCSLHYIEAQMKAALSSRETQATPDTQLYLWYFNQVVHFQILLDHSHNPQQAQEMTALMQQQVLSNIAEGIFGLRVVNDEDDDYEF